MDQTEIERKKDLAMYQRKIQAGINEVIQEYNTKISHTDKIASIVFSALFLWYSTVRTNERDFSEYEKMRAYIANHIHSLF